MSRTKQRCPREAQLWQQDTTSIGTPTRCELQMARRRRETEAFCDSAESKVIPAGGKALIDTQISIAVPVGTYGRVAPRSGLGV